jgi:hypothetical protein
VPLAVGGIERSVANSLLIWKRCAHRLRETRDRRQSASRPPCDEKLGSRRTSCRLRGPRLPTGLRDGGPTVDGFLVSATALRRPAVSDVCDIANYVDALTVPALVIPGNPKGGVSDFAKRGENVGDLVVAMVPGSTNPVFAVVGDIGPAGELGEGSVALNGKLLGKIAEPVNYNEVRGRKPFSGRGWVVPTALVLVFPATRDAQNPFMTTSRIDEAAKRRFGDWGGIARLNTCGEEYARK